MKIAKPGEICIRAGGDEFYMLGVGRYTEEDLEERKKMFEENITLEDQNSGKPYPITASIGCVLVEMSDQLQINSVINMADVEMYKSKVERKKQRI